ncbi:MAG: hypothetical protein MESAZ_00499 [Saezia sanguinis]
MASLNFRTEKLNFKNFYSKNQTVLDNARLMFSTLISSLLSAEKNISLYSISSRLKSRDEAVRKFTRKYQESLENEKIPYEIKDHITDLVGLRIVLLYESDIQVVGDILKSEFDVIEVTNKTRILESKGDAFGYKGLHLDLKLSANRAAMREYAPYASLRFEVQIRTIIQDAWSVLDHKIKYKKAIPKYLERRINSLAALFEIADREFLNIHEDTQAEEAKAHQHQNGDENINAFTFSQIIKDKLSGFANDESRIGEFVDFLLSYGDLSYNQLVEYIDRYHDLVYGFFNQIKKMIKKNYQMDVMSFLFFVLYAADRKKYKDIIHGMAEGEFLEYLNSAGKGGTV